VPATFVLALTCKRNTTLFAECPTEVTITVSGGPPYKEDYVLTCTSDGYDPIYTWTGTAGVDGGSVTATASSYTLLEGPFTLVCTATVNELNCSACEVIIGTAYSKY